MCCFFVRYTLGEDCETEASFDANRASVYSKRSLCSVILEPLFGGWKKGIFVERTAEHSGE